MLYEDCALPGRYATGNGELDHLVMMSSNGTQVVARERKVMVQIPCPYWLAHINPNRIFAFDTGSVNPLHFGTLAAHNTCRANTRSDESESTCRKCRLPSMAVCLSYKPTDLEHCL